MGNRMVHGRCGICGGDVTTPFAWHGIIPPVPTCESCGAVVDHQGPTLPMRPAPLPQFPWQTGTRTDDNTGGGK